MIEPGLEKTLYKLIKKKTGQKVDLLVGFRATLVYGNADQETEPIVFVCGLTEDALWLINEDKVQPIPLQFLQPLFEKPEKGSNIREFKFELLSNRQIMSIKSAEATGDNGFALWLTMLATRNGYKWWS
jgi:hypothetical protein